MARPERVLDDDGGPVARLAADLRRLREAAGRPGYRKLAASAFFSASTLAAAAGGRRLPSLAVTLAYVHACGGDTARWEARWREVEADLVARADAAGVGRTDTHAGQPPPYRGLASYQPEDAEWFFGREQLVTDIVQRLSERRFLAVFGPSGVGKSSLLRAGVVPAVRAGALAEGTGWPVVVMTPGRHPLGEFAVRLARRAGVSAGAVLDDLHRDAGLAHLVVGQALADEPPGVELLLVVDQFEEVFTLCADEERADFVRAMLAVTASPGSRARVMLGVRADFFARCVEHPDLVEAMSDAQVVVGPMTAVQVRDAVSKPAERAGLMIDGALVSTVVAAVAGRAGGLPLVSHALLEAWRRRRGNAITLAGYEAAGGLDGAVAKTAENLYADLDDDQRHRCREVLLRMIEIGPDGVVGGRRVVLSEFDGDEPDSTVLLERLADARLLTLDDGTARLAHEALASAWPRLRCWVDEDRDGLRIHRQLTQSAAIWQSLDHEPAALYRGTRLLDCLEWSRGHPTRLSPAEQRFLDASATASHRETLVRRRRLRLTLAALASVLVAISVLAGLTLVQAERARTERDLAISRQLIADAHSQLPVDPELALLLAKRVYDRDPAEAETILRQATLESRLVAAFTTARELELYGIAYDPAGRYLAAAGDSVRVWDTTTRAEQAFDNGWDPSGGVPAAGCRRQQRGVAYSPDGRHLAMVRPDGVVAVWEVARPSDPTLVGDAGTPACAVAFSPDGQRIASADEDGTVRIRRVDGSGHDTALREHQGPVRAVAFSPDGRQVATAGEDRRILIQSVAGGGHPVLLTTTGEAATAVAFHPDGRHVASGALDGTARDSSTAQGPGGLTVLSMGSQVSSVAYSPDGLRLAAAQADGLIQIFARNGKGLPLVLRGHKGAVSAVAFSPDGQRLASAGLDGTVRVWDIGGWLRPRSLTDASQRRIWAAAVSPDGRYVAGAADDGAVLVWDARGNGTPRVLPGLRGRVHGVRFSADGRWLAGIDDDGTICVWPLTASAAPVVVPARVPGDSVVMPLALSPDGRRLAVGGSDGVYLLAVDGGGSPRRLAKIPYQTWAVAFSPDGRFVADASDGGVVRVIDTTGRQAPVVVHRHVGPAYSVAFSPDGRRVASAGRDATVRTTRLDGGGSAVLAGQATGSRTIAFSPDGRLIATTGQDAIRVWRVDGNPDPIVLAGPLSFDSVAFGPDGGQLVTTSHDSAVRIWQCEVCGPMDQVLALANQRISRQLTADERRLFLPDPRS